MLSYALAIAVGTSSLVLFFTAFVLSDLHRQDDFIWSGVGLFYALVLWYCAPNITGAVLLGQAAATALIIALCWQNLKLRQAIARPESAAAVKNGKFSWLRSITSFGKGKSSAVKPVAPPSTADTSQVKESEIAIPNAVSPPTPAKISKLGETVIQVDQEQATAKKEPVLQPIVKAPEESPDIDAPEPEAEVNDFEETENQKSSVFSDEEVNETQSTSEIIEEDQAPATSEEELQESQTISEIAVESEVKTEDTDPNSTYPTDVAAPEIKAPESVLDSLETVEVAEVLEAKPEERSDASDRSNIIDVTTTEVESEAADTEPAPEEDQNSNPEKS
ncbi:MAG: Ycf66 family protein [Cyanobacteria bacterium J06621_8]